MASARDQSGGLTPGRVANGKRLRAKSCAPAPVRATRVYRREMPRARRILVEHGIYHVFSRGNRRQPIFLDERDFARFLEFLDEVVARYGWIVHAYCLMPNHYHLLVETPEANLSEGMHRLGFLYAQWFNRRHDVDGHLFQGRFGARLVESNYHLLETARYIVLNPVRAGLCRHAGDSTGRGAAIAPLSARRVGLGS
jgi:REP element-mobilizing transposase RayT